MMHLLTQINSFSNLVWGGHQFYHQMYILGFTFDKHKITVVESASSRIKNYTQFLEFDLKFRLVAS